MYSLRTHLRNHVVLLQLKELVIKKAKNPAPRTITALYLKEVFDNVTHESMLRKLKHTGCGERTFNYIQDFLRNRAATITIREEEKSPPIALGDKGTPQGSVLSTLFFNLELLPLPRLLQKIEGIDHALYAGSERWIEESLQRAAETMHEYAKT